MAKNPKASKESRESLRRIMKATREANKPAPEIGKEPRRAGVAKLRKQRPVDRNQYGVTARRLGSEHKNTSAKARHVRNVGGVNYRSAVATPESKLPTGSEKKLGAEMATQQAYKLNPYRKGGDKSRAVPNFRKQDLPSAGKGSGIGIATYQKSGKEYKHFSGSLNVLKKYFHVPVEMIPNPRVQRAIQRSREKLSGVGKRRQLSRREEHHLKEENHGKGGWDHIGMGRPGGGLEHDSN